MSAPCPTARTGITSQPRETAIPSQVQLAIEQETIQEMHTIMELVTQSILVHVEDSTTTIVTAIKPTFQREPFGKDRYKTEIEGHQKRCP
jgi:hypothetical protein